MLQLNVSEVQQDLLPIQYGGAIAGCTWCTFPKDTVSYHLMVFTKRGYSVRYGGAVSYSNEIDEGYTNEATNN